MSPLNQLELLEQDEGDASHWCPARSRRQRETTRLQGAIQSMRYTLLCALTFEFLLPRVVM